MFLYFVLYTGLFASGDILDVSGHSKKSSLYHHPLLHLLPLVATKTIYRIIISVNARMVVLYSFLALSFFECEKEG